MEQLTEWHWAEFADAVAPVPVMGHNFQQALMSSKVANNFEGTPNVLLHRPELGKTFQLLGETHSNSETVRDHRQADGLDGRRLLQQHTRQPGNALQVAEGMADSLYGTLQHSGAFQRETARYGDRMQVADMMHYTVDEWKCQKVLVHPRDGGKMLFCENHLCAWCLPGDLAILRPRDTVGAQHQNDQGRLSKAQARLASLFGDDEFLRTFDSELRHLLHEASVGRLKSTGVMKESPKKGTGSKFFAEGKPIFTLSPTLTKDPTTTPSATQSEPGAQAGSSASPLRAAAVTTKSDPGPAPVAWRNSEHYWPDRKQNSPRFNSLASADARKARMDRRRSEKGGREFGSQWRKMR